MTITSGGGQVKEKRRDSRMQGDGVVVREFHSEEATFELRPK